MVEQVSPAGLKELLDFAAPLALIDVREAGEYNSAHIPSSSSVPRGQLEFRMPALVPFRGTFVVACDDDGRRAPLAAATLERMGYGRVAILAGGIHLWVTRGFATEWGMNVPSKEFGERLKVERGVPEIGPDELHTRLEQGDDLVLLDARTPEEHRRSTIPGSLSLPGGELALRIFELARGPANAVVVHCAGRTRSLVGAGLLRRMGLPNVLALRNGTAGWLMAGQELERGSQRLELPPPSPQALALAEAFAARIAAEDGVRFLSPEELRGLMRQAVGQNVHLIDVRTREEFAAGHIPGFRWVPGGQAVQQADDVVAVRNASIVFACDGQVRSTVAASWYRQLGFPNAFALRGGIGAWSAAGLPLETGLPVELPFGYQEARGRVDLLTPEALRAALAGPETPLVIFVDSSARFSRGHVPSARWLPRGWLEPRIGELAPSQAASIVVTCANGLNSVLAGATLRELGYRKVTVLDGGMDAWRKTGLPLETGLSGVTAPPDDMPPDLGRNLAEMINYLRWEEELGRKFRSG